MPTDGADYWTLTPAPLAGGSHTAVATATDAAGNTASDSTTFTVDATAPVIVITTPVDGSSTSDQTPPITGTSDVISGAITVVIDGGTPITVPTDPNGDWIVTPTTALGNGAHVIVATTVDEAGNTSTATSRLTVGAADSAGRAAQLARPAWHSPASSSRGSPPWRCSSCSWEWPCACAASSAHRAGRNSGWVREHLIRSQL